MWNREQWMQEREKRDKGRSSRRWEGFACLITLITISRWHLCHVVVDAQRHKHTHTQITSIIPRECNSHSEFNIPSAISGERWGGGVSEGRQMWALDWGYTALEFLSFFPTLFFFHTAAPLIRREMWERRREWRGQKERCPDSAFTSTSSGEAQTDRGRWSVFSLKANHRHVAVTDLFASGFVSVFLVVINYLWTFCAILPSYEDFSH